MTCHHIVEKGLTIGIIFLCFGTSIISSTEQRHEAIGSSLPISKGNTLYVGGSGPGNYTRIQDAIDDASAGDTVFVYDASSPYFEHLEVNKTIVLVGQNKNTTVIDGSNSIDPIVNVTSDNVIVHGFSIQNGGGNGIYVTANYTRIDSNIIKNNINSGILVYIQSIFHNDTISNNVISNNHYFGVYVILDYEKEGASSPNFLQSPDYTVIKQNIITFSETGIETVRCWKDMITDNVISNFSSTGIFVGDGDETSILNNTIESQNKGQGIGIWLFIPNTMTIKGNTLRNNKYGELSTNSGNNVFENNRITNNIVGMNPDNGHSDKICYNTFLNNSDYGLQLTGTQGETVVNNTFRDNEYGLYLDPNAMSNTIKTNQFFHDGVFILGEYNSLVNNTVNGRPLIYCNKMVNATIDGMKAGEIILFHCDSITIQNQNLSNASVGVELWYSNNCLITRNILSDNVGYGVFLKFSSNCVVTRNTISNNNAYGVSIGGGTNNNILLNNIEKNGCGLSWVGTSNTVEKNNFISNQRDAGFHKFSRCGCTTHWIQNYWDQPRNLPKLIRGKIDIFLFQGPYNVDIEITVPWAGMDWHPAKSPYII